MDPYGFTTWGGADTAIVPAGGGLVAPRSQLVRADALVPQVWGVYLIARRRGAGGGLCTVRWILQGGTGRAVQTANLPVPLGADAEVPLLWIGVAQHWTVTAEAVCDPAAAGDAIAWEAAVAPWTPPSPMDYAALRALARA